jgi:hypothetical protein
VARLRRIVPSSLGMNDTTGAMATSRSAKTLSNFFSEDVAIFATVHGGSDRLRQVLVLVQCHLGLLSACVPSYRV